METVAAPQAFAPLAVASVFALDDCLVWLEPDTGRVAVLNPTASLIWLLCEEGRTPAGIAAELADRYAASFQQCHSDVLAALQDWAVAGLLEPADSARTENLANRETFSPPPGPTGRPSTKRMHCVLDETFEIRYFGDTLPEYVEPWLRHWQCPPGALPRHQLDVYQVGAEYCVSGPGFPPLGHLFPERLKSLVAGRLIQACVPAADLFAILHAGAVGDGRHCVLLAGVSGAGKSTLTAALVQSGLSYLGDDLIPFNQRTGCALPFPTAFSLKEGSWETVSRFCPELASQPAFQHEGQQVRYLPLASTVPASGLPVCGMIFPRYLPGAATQLRPIGAATAFQRLLSSCSWLRPPVSLDDFEGFLGRLEQLPCCELEYSALDEAVSLIREVFPA